MLTLDTLTEDDVRRLAGPALFAQAEALLRTGQVAERMRFEDGSIDAFVADGHTTHNPSAADEHDQIVTDCDCGYRGGACSHVIALLIAWVRERRSFAEEGVDAGAPDDLGDEGDWVEAYAGPGARNRSGVVEQPADTRPEYLRLLNLLTVAQLRALAKRRNVTLAGTRREPIIEALADALSRPEAVAEAWPSLSRSARLLLGLLALIKTEHQIHLTRVREVFKLIDAKAGPKLGALLDELVEWGLIVVTPYQMIDLPHLLLLPPDPEFTLLHPDGAKLKPLTPAPAPLDFTLLATRILLALKAGGDRFRARPAPPLQPVERQLFGLSGWPHDPDEVKALMAGRRNANDLYGKTLRVMPAPPLLADESHADLGHLVGDDPGRVNFALRLLAALGAVRAAPGKPIEVIEERFGDFIARPPLARALSLYAASSSLADWTELDRLATLRPGVPQLRHFLGGYDQGYPHLLAQLSLARVMLLWYLRRAPAGQWVDFDAFVARARALLANPDFWPSNNSTWHLALDGRRPNAAHAGDWQATYGAFVETVLSGPQAWQGALELAYRNNRPIAFRLTDFGARLLGQTRDFDLPRTLQVAGPALALTPQGDLILRAEAAQTDVLSLIAQLCEVRNDARGGLTYRPAPAGASRLFEAGWTDEKLIAALGEALGAAPPESLAQSIRTWWHNFGAVHLYADVALIELADDYALNELLAGTSLAQYLLYRFSPRLIAVRADGVEALRTEWVKRGYTPKTVTAEGG